MAATNHNRKSSTTLNGRQTRILTRRILADFDGARRDGGLSVRQLALASGVSQPHLSQVFAGKREPSIAVLNAIARALGGDVWLRFFPTTGPVIHDGVQARIVEELVRIASPSWATAVEVAVHRPARGYIDVVFDSQPLATIVATEVETRIDRLEQQLRWAQDKASSLPSAALWSSLDGGRSISRLLVLRSTATTRDLARRFEGTLRIAYPASSAAVYGSLTEGEPWPGAGILWAHALGDVVRILARPPRGVDVGR